MSDPRHDLVAAKWDEMRAEAKKQGMPVIVSFYDGAKSDEEEPELEPRDE